MPTIDDALSYARAGWLIFPLHTIVNGICTCKEGGDCHSPGKHPRNKHGHNEGTSDEQQISRWWKQWPNSNIGLWCKGLIVVDVDPRNGGDVSLEDLFSAKADQYGFETLTALTGGGGHHYIFNAPDEKGYDCKPVPGIEIKSSGGLIVISPSVHISGRNYQWEDDTVPIAPAPQWLLNLIDQPAKQVDRPAFTGKPLDLEAFIAKHNIQTKAPKICRCKFGGYQWDLVGDCPFQPGYAGGNAAIGVTDAGATWFSCFCGDHQKKTWADFKAIYETKKVKKPQPQYAGSSPQPKEEYEYIEDTSEQLGVDLEVADAIARDDMAAIWNMLKTLAAMPVAEYQINRAAIKAHFKTKISLSALDEAVDELKPEYDDDGSSDLKLAPNKVANEILKKHDLINVSDNLYEYDGKKWVPIATSRLHTLALQEDGEFVTTKQRRTEIVSFITSKIYTNKHEWRQIQPYEVPVANGVIDIRTMKMRPHRKEDYLQTCIPWAYNEKAQCPELMRCLDTYFGKDTDGDLKIAALQEYFGYCLMPHARYKKALLCVGESDCGKSTIPYLLRQLLGSENIAAVSVEHMDDDRKRAPLLGKLVNLLTELTSDAMIADGGFKTLVSTEEPILFDPKHLAPVMDIPICKHVIVTNKKPRINDKSNATYRRLLLIHFNHVIPASEQDTTVWDRLKAEIDGILSWALEGATRIYQQGGRFSDPGVAEIAEYRNDQNPMLTFLEHYCERDQHCDTRTSVFIERFKHSIPGKWSASAILDMAREAGLVVEKHATSEGAGAKYRHVKGIRIT